MLADVAKKHEHATSLQNTMTMARTTMIFRHFAFGSALPAPVQASDDDSDKDSKERGEQGEAKPEDEQAQSQAKGKR